MLDYSDIVVFWQFTTQGTCRSFVRSQPRWRPYRLHRGSVDYMSSDTSLGQDGMSELSLSVARLLGPVLHPYAPIARARQGESQVTKTALSIPKAAQSMAELGRLGVSMAYAAASQGRQSARQSARESPSQRKREGRQEQKQGHRLLGASMDCRLQIRCWLRLPPATSISEL